MSVVTSEAWATKFGSKAAKAMASSAALLPQIRQAHQPISRIKPTPRSKLANRAASSN